MSKSEPNTPDTEYVSVKLADISARLHRATYYQTFMLPSGLRKTMSEKQFAERKEKQSTKEKIQLLVVVCVYQIPLLKAKAAERNAKKC